MTAAVIERHYDIAGCYSKLELRHLASLFRTVLMILQWRIFKDVFVISMCLLAFQLWRERTWSTSPVRKALFTNFANVVSNLSEGTLRTLIASGAKVEKTRAMGN
jgi:hypothetical protein